MAQKKTPLLDKALELYGLGYLDAESPQKGYRNHSHPLILKDAAMANLILYKSELGILNKIRLANKVSDYLNQQGLPARHALDKRILKVQAGNSVRYAMLYNYLPGQTIPWEAYTRAHLKVLGQTMAKMHQALQVTPKTTAPDVAEEYHKIVQRMNVYFADPDVQKAMQKKLGLEVNVRQLDYFKNILIVCQKLSNQQMLHMDFVRGNILFSNDNGKVKVSGILDFEKAAYGIVLFDIARTLAFLLVDCKYKTSEEIHKQFLISGYIRHGQAEFNDIVLKSQTKKISLLETLVDLFMTYDFYKFLRHNPYEFLPQNEHFVRTRDILLKSNLLHHIP